MMEATPLAATDHFASTRRIVRSDTSAPAIERLAEDFSPAAVVAACEAPSAFAAPQGAPVTIADEIALLAFIMRDNSAKPEARMKAAEQLRTLKLAAFRMAGGESAVDAKARLNSDGDYEVEVRVTGPASAQQMSNTRDTVQSTLELLRRTGRAGSTRFTGAAAEPAPALEAHPIKVTTPPESSY